MRRIRPRRRANGQNTFFESASESRPRARDLWCRLIAGVYAGRRNNSVGKQRAATRIYGINNGSAEFGLRELSGYGKRSAPVGRGRPPRNVRRTKVEGIATHFKRGRYTCVRLRFQSVFGRLKRRTEKRKNSCRTV